MRPESLPPFPSKSNRQVIRTVEDAELRLSELNALEGFERWRLKVLPEAMYQVLELDAGGRVRWQSFRRESIRVVVGWAAQQTNKRIALQRETFEVKAQIG
jgi:hypothetical protein